MEFPENELRENRVKIYMKKYAKVVKMTDHIKEKKDFLAIRFFITTAPSGFLDCSFV